MELLKTQNESLKQAKINVLLSKIDLNEAKNAKLPTFSLNAGNNYNYGLAFDQVVGELITKNKLSNNANAAINIRIPIFQGFTLTSKVKQALLAIEINNLTKDKLEQVLKLDIISKYFEAITNKSLYNSSIKQLQFSKDQLNQEQTKFDLGANTLLDVTQAEIQLVKGV